VSTTRRVGDAGYEGGERTIDCDDLGLLDEEALTERLLRAFEDPAYHPPRLPEVARELLALTRNPNASFAHIESLLERDSMLAGEVLSIARSVFYNRHGADVNLHDALTRLGLEKLRAAVLQAAMSLRVFRSVSYRVWMERLQDHSVMTAHIGRFVSRYTSLPEEEVFLCGLLHDVGIAGILLVLGEPREGKKAPFLDTLWPAIHGAHPVAGARMVHLWGLPAEISMAVAAHHEVRIDGVEHPIAAALCLAERLAGERGWGLVPPRGVSPSVPVDVHDRIDRSDETGIERARAALGLNDTALGLIRADVLAWIRAASNERAE
jgi:HD-like signal output (HDOD) protein